MLRVFACGLGLVSLLGCGGATVQSEQVKARASQHLACNAESLQIVDDKPFEKTVSGCGRQLTYHRQCAGQTCYWVAQKPDR